MAAADVLARLKRRTLPIGGSDLGKPYGLHNLLSDCKMGLMTEDVLKAVWFALAQYIAGKINCDKPKGVIVADFGAFSKFKTGHSLWRPAPEFKKNMSCVEPSRAPQVPAMKLPYSAIAVLAQVTQETAAAAIRRMVQELAVQVRRGLSLNISMGELGVLWSRGRTCGFKFEKKKKKRTVRRKAPGPSSVAKKAPKPVELPEPPRQQVAAPPESEPEPQPQPEPEYEPEVDDSYIPPVSSYATKPTVVAAIAARNPPARKKRALPKFLQPDRFRGRQTAAALRAVVLEQRYEDLAAELQESQDRIDKQERDIVLRRERAELEHRAKLERLRRRKEQNLEVLGTMAEEKRIRDKEAAYDHRMQRDPDPSRSIPQQIEPDATALSQVKSELREELDKLILQNKITKRMEEKNRLKEERFFLDNLHQELLDDHRHRRAVKKNSFKNLRSEWERQTELSRISRSLRDTETM